MLDWATTGFTSESALSHSKENLAWLDLLRVAAALAVVVLHVSAEPVVFEADRNSAIWQAANVFDSLSRWSIGVFIMVSGALLLDPSRHESAGEFYKKRARRILVPIIFWSLAYFALAVAMGTPMTTNRAGRLIWEGRPAYHMWYLFMILGLYAVTPLLRIHVLRSGSALRWSVALVLLAAASAWDLHLSIEGQPLPKILPTMFIPYLGYYLIGCELRRLAPIGAHAGLFWAMVLLGAAATMVGTYALVGAYYVTRLGLYMYEYLSPNVIVMSVGLFCLASGVEIERAEGAGTRAWLSRMVAWVAPLTLGIYLWHPMLILALRELGVTALGTGSVLGVLIVALPAFFGSLLLTWGMSQVPLLRQSVGL